MSVESIPNIMMIVFTITTVVVFLYPIVKLTPSWLERSMGKKVIAHRDALAAIGSALASTDDTEQRARLQAQHDYHRAALNTLVPGDAQAQQVAAERAAA